MWRLENQGLKVNLHYMRACLQNANKLILVLINSIAVAPIGNWATALVELLSSMSKALSSVLRTTKSKIK